jgi:hypothetical protein
MFKANREGAPGLSEKHDRIMAPLVGRFAELLGAKLAA